MFIKLHGSFTSPTDNDIFVIAEYITIMERGANEKGACIWLGDTEYSIKVKESPEEILAIMFDMEALDKLEEVK